MYFIYILHHRVLKYVQMPKFAVTILHAVYNDASPFWKNACGKKKSTTNHYPTLFLVLIIYVPQYFACSEFMDNQVYYDLGWAG